MSHQLFMPHGRHCAQHVDAPMLLPRAKLVWLLKILTKQQRSEHDDRCLEVNSEGLRRQHLLSAQ